MVGFAPFLSRFTHLAVTPCFLTSLLTKVGKNSMTSVAATDYSPEYNYEEYSYTVSGPSISLSMSVFWVAAVWNMSPSMKIIKPIHSNPKPIN